MSPLWGTAFGENNTNEEQKNIGGGPQYNAADILNNVATNKIKVRAGHQYNMIADSPDSVRNNPEISNKYQRNEGIERFESVVT